MAQLLAIDLPSREFELQFEKTLTRLASERGASVARTAHCPTRREAPYLGGGQRGVLVVVDVLARRLRMMCWRLPCGFAFNLRFRLTAALSSVV